MVKIYWAVLGLLGFLHLFLGLGEIIPYYVSLLLVSVVVFYFSRKVFVGVESLGLMWNDLLFAMQLALLLMAAWNESILLSVFPFLLFIGLEIVRLAWGKRFAELNRVVSKHEEQLEQLNETFRVVRSERHDFLKHISAIHFMLDNNKPFDAKTYLDQLVESYEETNHSIKGESGVVAGVLHQAYLRGKKSGVEVIYDLDLPLSTLPLSDQKIVALIGNLLSNSLDACEEWQSVRGEQASIILEFYKRSGLYILRCKNNSLTIPPPILDELFHSYGKTTKGGEHEGLGTKLIKEILEEHHGFLDFVHKDEEFDVKIKIPAIR